MVSSFPWDRNSVDYRSDLCTSFPFQHVSHEHGPIISPCMNRKWLSGKDRIKNRHWVSACSRGVSRILIAVTESGRSEDHWCLCRACTGRRDRNKSISNDISDGRSDSSRFLFGGWRWIFWNRPDGQSFCWSRPYITWGSFWWSITRNNNRHLGGCRWLGNRNDSNRLGGRIEACHGVILIGRSWGHALPIRMRSPWRIAWCCCQRSNTAQSRVNHSLSHVHCIGRQGNSVYNCGYDSDSDRTSKSNRFHDSSRMGENDQVSKGHIVDWSGCVPQESSAISSVPVISWRPAELRISDYTSKRKYLYLEWFSWWYQESKIHFSA